uniref:Uncharacterized protein n=1 Tax=Strongyloides stercoralis TaxID=6248 RepID=A0A0K0DYM7_STRER
MGSNGVLKIQLINQTEREKLLASEKQRRRLLRMKEAKEQANILSKLNRENNKILNSNTHQKTQYNKSYKNHINQICYEVNVCPRLRRYYQFLEKNKEYNNIFSNFSTKYIQKPSNT